MKNSLSLIVILYVLILTSLFVGCGSAEAFKDCIYPKTKNNLERAVILISNYVLTLIVALTELLFIPKNTQWTQTKNQIKTLLINGIMNL